MLDATHSTLRLFSVPHEKLAVESKVGGRGYNKDLLKEIIVETLDGIFLCSFACMCDSLGCCAQNRDGW